MAEAKVVVYVALGSNLGDRAANLAAALAELAAFALITARSAVYESNPKYVTDQPVFLNMVVQAETTLTPTALLAACQEIERAIGRVPGRRFGPRKIDLDILFYGDAVVATPDLQIPHPRLGERAFVLVPLADVAAALRHPETGLTVAEMRDASADDGGLRPYRE